MDTENNYGMKEMHLSLLEMLDKFLLLCGQNGIVFSMGFGSMLGAIRHKGFIPWDDDVDIIIDRDNFILLSSVIKGSNEFELLVNQKETLWIPRIRKKGKRSVNLEYEPTIDLFIVDNMPNGSLAAKVKKIGVLFIQGMIKGRPDFKKGTLFLKFASAISYFAGLFFTINYKYRLLEFVSTLSNNYNTKNCSTYNVEYIYIGRKYNGRLLDDIIEIDFEGRKVPVSKYYDSYLTELYGDYMTPPKTNERRPKHS